MDRAVIDQYQSASRSLSEAIAGLSPEELARTPPADVAATLGGWSIQQVVIHLADAELVYAERMKRVIAEDDPPLLAFDQDRWATWLNYEHQSTQDAVAVIEL